MYLIYKISDNMLKKFLDSVRHIPKKKKMMVISDYAILFPTIYSLLMLFMHRRNKKTFLS